VNSLDLISKLSPEDLKVLRVIQQNIEQGYWDEAIGLLKQAIESQEKQNNYYFEDNASEYFLMRLKGDNLVKYCNLDPNIKNVLAKVIRNKMRLPRDERDRKDINYLLKFGYKELKLPSVASIYIKHLPLKQVDSIQESLDLAAKDRSNIENIRRCIKIYILKNQRETALELALEYAQRGDKECIHMLIHVFGYESKEWAKRLQIRRQPYLAATFKEDFESFGLKMMPKSELETIELHDLEEAEKENQKKAEVAKSYAHVNEKWICRSALNQYAKDQSKDSWLIASCEEHKNQMVEFSKSFNFKPLSDNFWEEEAAEVVLNALTFDPSEDSLVGKKLANQSFRAWQQKAIDKWVSHGRQGIIEAATGSGKSKVGAIAALEALEEGFAVVIVTPTQVLQQQWIRDYFTSLWNAPKKQIFTMGNDKGMYSRPTTTLMPGTITVAVVDSLAKFEYPIRSSMTRVLIIADEVHNYTGDKFRKILLPEYERRMGLTATLAPPPGRYGVLANYFGGDPIYRYTFDDAVADGAISHYNLMLIRIPMDPQIFDAYTSAYKFMVYAKRALISTGLVRETPAEFEIDRRKLQSAGTHLQLLAEYEKWFKESDELLSNTLSKSNSMRLVAPFIKKRGRAIAFTDFSKTAENISHIFANNAINAEVIDQYVPQKIRDEVFRKIPSKEVQAVISPQALDEGVDIKELNVGIFAGTSRRMLRIIQRLGRVLRNFEGKLTPLIILPVFAGTEEDPFIEGNEHLQRSSYGMVYKMANEDGRYVFEVHQEEEIKQFLNSLPI
jgi:superfamily II DNA or RNA helicase